MKVSKISGKGWIKKSSYGFGRSIRGQKYSDLRSLYALLKEKGIFRIPVENFARFDQASKLTVIAAALALHDAKVSYAKGQVQDIGILGTSLSGSAQANSDYLEDYLQAGRILGRGNLFIYTLATSPLAETAIHFGLGGPLLFLGYRSGHYRNILKHAELMLKAKDTQALLVVQFSQSEAVASFIQRKP